MGLIAATYNLLEKFFFSCQISVKLYYLLKVLVLSLPLTHVRDEWLLKTLVVHTWQRHLVIYESKSLGSGQNL